MSADFSDFRVTGFDGWTTLYCVRCQRTRTITVLGAMPCTPYDVVEPSDIESWDEDAASLSAILSAAKRHEHR